MFATVGLVETLAIAAMITSPVDVPENIHEVVMTVHRPTVETVTYSTRTVEPSQFTFIRAEKSEASTNLSGLFYEDFVLQFQTDDQIVDDFYLHDLNDDGIFEAVIQFSMPYVNQSEYCSPTHGCRTIIVKWNGYKWEEILSLTGQYTIQTLQPGSLVNSGYNDIRVTSYPLAGGQPYTTVYEYRNGQYVVKS